MIQYLSDKNKAKADWIEQVSFAFNMFGGYFVDEHAGEVELIFSELYENKLRIYIRDYSFTDISEFVNIMIKKSYAFLYNLINEVHNCSNDRLKVIDFYANAGFASVDMKLKLKESEFITISATIDDLNQYKKNVLSTGIIETSYLHNALSTGRSSLLFFDRDWPRNIINQSTPSAIHVETFQPAWFEYECDIILTIMKIHGWNSVNLLRIGVRGVNRLLASVSLPQILQATKNIIVDVSVKSPLCSSLQHILQLQGFQIKVMDETTIGWK